MAHLLCLVNEVRENLGNHIKDNEKAQQSLKKTQEKADEIISEVKKKETEISDRIARLEETARAEQQSSQRLQTQMVKMQEQLNETQNQLNDTKSDLLKMNGDLHTGQTAYNFEKHLAAHIYPPGTPVTHGRIFTTLMKWLKEKKHTREGRDANTKWENLKRDFGWTNDEEQTAVFFKMLKCREEHAHPEVNFALPIPENFNESEKKCVQVIRNMTIKLNEEFNQHDRFH